MRKISNLKEIQSMALLILEKLDRYCSDNQIEYYMAYGSLLGAIRHKGFIPWDDDVDLWMKRDSYDKFCKHFPEWGSSNGLYLNSIYTTKNYNRIQAKVCMCNTEITENSRCNLYKEGYAIDIFPLDGTPNNSWNRFFYLGILQIIKNIATLSAYKDKNNKTITLFARLFRKVKVNSVLKYYEVLARRYPCRDSNYLKVIAPGKRMGRDILVKSNCFNESQSIPFENVMTRVPSGFNEILQKIYGDYMKLPPVELRKSHHNFTLYVKD